MDEKSHVIWSEDWTSGDQDSSILSSGEGGGGGHIQASVQVPPPARPEDTEQRIYHNRCTEKETIFIIKNKKQKKYKQTK